MPEPASGSIEHDEEEETEDLDVVNRAYALGNLGHLPTTISTIASSHHARGSDRGKLWPLVFDTYKNVILKRPLAEKPLFFEVPVDTMCDGQF